MAAEADTQIFGQMDRRQSPGSHGTYSEGSTAQHLVGKAPGREGWGDWDGQTDGQSSISQPDSPTPMPPPPISISISMFLSLSVSLFLSANHSFLEPPREKWEKKTEMREKDEGPCVCVCVCVQHKV